MLGRTSILLSVGLLCLSVGMGAFVEFAVAAGPVKKRPEKVRTAPAKPSSSAKTPSWPLLTCGKDLKDTARNIDVYQKKLTAAVDPLPLARRQDLYARNSVLSESLTLLAPEVFWKDIIASRGTRGCYRTFTFLKKSMQTNDSQGTPKKLSDWNLCVSAIYGTLPAQSRRINECVKRGVAYIKSRKK
jgi:hypothetical protein